MFAVQLLKYLVEVFSLKYKLKKQKQKKDTHNIYPERQQFPFNLSGKKIWKNENIESQKDPTEQIATLRMQMKRLKRWNGTSRTSASLASDAMSLAFFLKCSFTVWGKHAFIFLAT